MDIYVKLRYVKLRYSIQMYIAINDYTSFTATFSITEISDYVLCFIYHPVKCLY